MATRLRERDLSILRYLRDNGPNTAHRIGLRAIHGGKNPGGRIDAGARNTLEALRRRGLVSSYKWAYIDGEWSITAAGEWSITAAGRKAIREHLGSLSGSGAVCKPISDRTEMHQIKRRPR